MLPGKYYITFKYVYTSLVDLIPTNVYIEYLSDLKCFNCVVWWVTNKNFKLINNGFIKYYNNLQKGWLSIQTLSDHKLLACHNIVTFKRDL